MAEKDYYSFDEVLRDLSMEEDELKRLVSAGEIRAFRDQDTMRFKAADIERLRRPGDEGQEELDLDLDLDLGDDLELGGDFDLGDDDEELVLEDDGLEIEEVDLAEEARASSSREPRRRPARSPAEQPEEAVEGMGMRFALVMGFIILVFANFAALGAVAGQTNALTGFLSDMFG